MKSDVIYESHISTARWLIYDVPGNVGWILYLVCLIQCFVKWPAFMEIPLVWLSVMVGIIPAVAMAVGIVELISDGLPNLTGFCRRNGCTGASALSLGVVLAESSSD